MKDKLRAFTRRWGVPALIFAVSAGIFSAFAAERLKGPSSDPHFVYLANAYLDGSLELTKKPPHKNDWASYEWMKLKSGQEIRGVYLDRKTGRFRTLDGEVMVIDRREVDYKNRRTHYFVSFPPMPAVLMLPLAVIWGYDVNDVLFTVVVASLNVALFFLVLRRFAESGYTKRTRADNLWLTLLFGFGTVHFWCAVLGQVWFTALIVGVMFTLLYLLAALDQRHPLLAGILCACAFASRTPLLFASVFFLAGALLPGSRLRKEGWKQTIVALALFCAPCLIVGSLLLYANHLRFGSIFEFGHTYLAGGSIARIQTYGLFNFHFLSKNLSAALTLIPRFQPEYPWVIVSRHGMSLLLSTPALAYLLWPRPADGAGERSLRRLIGTTAAIVAVPALFYQNTGYEQFGYRFALDYLPFLVVLIAMSHRRITWTMRALICAGVVVNGFGAVVFKRWDVFFLPGSTFFDGG